MMLFLVNYRKVILPTGGLDGEHVSFNVLGDILTTLFYKRVYGQFCIEMLHESRKWKSNGFVLLI